MNERIKSATCICKNSILNQLPKMILIFLLIFLSACSHDRMGERGGPPPDGEMIMPQYTPEELISSMTDRLGLSDEQQEKVRPIMEEYCKKQKAIIEKYKWKNRENCCMKCELQRLGDSTGEQLAAFLPEEQMMKFREMMVKLLPISTNDERPKMDEKRPGGRGGMGGGMGGRGGMGGGMPPGM
ncbi:MAG: hypothetical protein KKC46_06865 [Proteobacteria bacterium]|nr:hypothetical protein [Pseudomonadota bacterium]